MYLENFNLYAQAILRQQNGKQLVSQNDTKAIYKLFAPFYKPVMGGMLIDAYNFDWIYKANTHTAIPRVIPNGFSITYLLVL